MSGRPMRTVIVRVFAGAAIVFLLVCAAQEHDQIGRAHV